VEPHLVPAKGIKPQQGNDVKAGFNYYCYAEKQLPAPTLSTAVYPHNGAAEHLQELSS
jgi:hypothetical protein